MSTTSHQDHSPDRVKRYLFVSGVLAALVMVVFMLVLRKFTASESMIEIVAGIILQFTPISVFSLLLQTFRGLAKPMLLTGVISGVLVVGGLLTRLDRGPSYQLSYFRKGVRIGGLAILVWLPIILIVLLYLASNSAVGMTNRELISIATTLFLDILVYAGSYYLIYPVVSGQWTVQEADSPPASLSRRRMIGRAATGVVTVGAALYVGNFLQGIRAGAVGGEGNEISPPITPNSKFYTVSKNFVDPSVGADGWKLEISGLVEQKREVSYDELLSMPSVEQSATLTCISNEIGGDLIDNAVWTGVRLSDLLALVDTAVVPDKIAFFGHDGYSDSFEFSKALEPTTIVAYLMNGEPLPKSHGRPARLIVPGKYGIKNGKWLRRLQLVGSFRGYWQQRGWTDIARINTMSKFDVPSSRAIVTTAPLEVGGVAFAGDRGISQVEFSDDDGETWSVVDRLEQVSPLSWSIWRTTWTPPGTGTYTLVVRATDGDGVLQTEKRSSPEPDGATGYHRIVVGVT